MIHSPLVSVIIPTLNEEKNIGRCLESIGKQTYPKERIEVIVVDNNSMDKTRKIVKKFASLCVSGFKQNYKLLNIEDFKLFERRISI